MIEPAGVLRVEVALDAARVLDRARLIVWEMTKRRATTKDVATLRAAAGRLGGIVRLLGPS